MAHTLTECTFNGRSAVALHPPFEHDVRARFGITRLADVSGLDRMRVPVMCAIVPDSEDDVSVYSGRGTSPEQARLSALMETVERQLAAPCRLAEHDEPLADCTIDLLRCGLDTSRYSETAAFIDGRDVLHNRAVAVPKALVQMPWRGEPLFPTTHTNGLAAGFTRDEALLHALYEVVERHLWSMTDARARLRPRKFVEHIVGFCGRTTDDSVDVVHLPTGDPVLDALCARANDSGTSVRLIALGDGQLPAAFAAAIAQRHGNTTRVHMGSACSWSARSAAVAALTEAVQSRVSDTLGIRENILDAAAPATRFSAHTRRRDSVPAGRWYYDAPARTINLGDVRTFDLPPETALRRLLDVLRDLHANVYEVVLSKPGDPFWALRVIVPELETAIVDDRVGPLAAAVVAQ